ncbi:DUF4956 domain-containing protein [Desulfococcaceae bacterium HSG7]|nr:DUF4956 domain-containing protein [Desulfococcaceae bacterium HSG7]
MNDWLIKQFSSGSNPWVVYQIWEISLALVVSFALCIILSLTYRFTHRGVSYMQSLVHTMVIMGVVSPLVMILIGNNIARAFSLLGAFSIIRFRTAMKEPRDVAFIFASMAIGMACGVRFYMHATIAMGVIVGAILLLHFLNLGQRETRNHILRILLPDGTDYRVVFEQVFEKYLDRSVVVSVGTARQGTMIEVVYDIAFRSVGKESDFMRALQELGTDYYARLMSGRNFVDK